VSSPSAGVECHGIWKQFRRGEFHDSLRDLVSSLVRPRDSRQVDERTFWALQDISFDVRPGQSLGVIGPNGSGKSTLLKLLSRILKPTRGHLRVQGRMGSLIEVAAGFHPDLTGRENVYLQGAIMGMKPSDIPRKFDQIVDFAGVAEFIDTPVKRYSSGMNARLGFAIAAHLDPDVLLIDEVLAVGDLGFQQKAFSRIRELVTSGIPVVLVSHQLDRVAELCTDCLLLDHGVVARRGSPNECIGEYLNPARSGAVASSDAPMIIEQMALVEGAVLTSGKFVQLVVRGAIRAPLPGHVEPLALIVRNASTGAIVSAVGSALDPTSLPVGGFEVAVELQMNVPPGIYVVESVVWNRSIDAPLATGPSITLQVGEGPRFAGSVQLNAIMRVQSIVR
jgi:lipopolysaccharide transport system ATP-binding protein